MSDSMTKPEEQQSVAADASKIGDIAVVESTSAEPSAAPESTDKVVEDVKSDGKKEEAKEEESEPKEITHGTLTKTHSGLLSLFKKRRYVFLRQAAFSQENLKAYLHKENASKANAAFACVTGRGLLFYSKDESLKETPHGIIKLADIEDVVASGNTKFVLKSANGDLQFEAPAAARDSWVFTLKGKITESKEELNSVVESEDYKSMVEKISKPATPAVKQSEPVAEAGDVTTETPEVKVDQNTETPAAEEDVSAADMKRSASKKGKRNSVFAMFAKKTKPESNEGRTETAAPDISADVAKTDHQEDKPVESSEAVTKTDDKADESSPVITAAESSAPVELEKAVEPVTTTSETSPEAAKSTEEPKTPPETATSPKSTKRLSLFGIFDKKEKAKPEDTPDGQADATETKETAPQKSKLLSNLFEKKEKEPAAVVEETGRGETAPTESQAGETSATAVASPEQPAAEPAAEDTVTELSPKEKKTGFFGNFIRKASIRSKSSERKAESKDVTTPEAVPEETNDATPTVAVVEPEGKPEDKPVEAGASTNPSGEVAPDTVGVDRTVQAAA